jgi:hypothetical protein
MNQKSRIHGCQGITLVQAAKAGEADAVSSALKNGADVNYIDKVSPFKI